MTPEIIAMLRLARVPWCPGMLANGGLRVTHFADCNEVWGCFDGESDLIADDEVPDLTDRATFLLCCDELECRGSWIIPNRSLACWRDLPDELFRVTVRALSESTPKDAQ